MKKNENDPPKLAIWLLKHACPGDQEALTGDLVERFCEGRSPGWVWKQVLVATAIAMLTEIRRHGPQITYALAGSAMMLAAPANACLRAQAFAHWWILPFPLSMLVWFLSPAALLAAAALPVLVVSQLLNGVCRWRVLFRTWLFSLMLITILPFLVFLPSFNQQSVKWPAAPFTVFYTLLISAWLGRHSSQRVPHMANRPTRMA
jgi:hypothetical protein